MEIPRRRSTTGESPLYDLRFRWTQARHIAKSDLRSRYNKQRCAGPQNCRTVLALRAKAWGASGFVQVALRPVAG